MAPCTWAQWTKLQRGVIGPPQLLSALSLGALAIRVLLPVIASGGACYFWYYFEPWTWYLILVCCLWLPWQADSCLPLGRSATYIPLHGDSWSVLQDFQGFGSCLTCSVYFQVGFLQLRQLSYCSLHDLCCNCSSLDAILSLIL